MAANWKHDKKQSLWTWDSPSGLYVVSEWEAAIFFPDRTSKHDCEETTEEMKLICEQHQNANPSHR